MSTQPAPGFAVDYARTADPMAGANVGPRVPAVRVALDRQVDTVGDTGRAAEELHAIIGALEDLAAILLPPQPIPGNPGPPLGPTAEAPLTCALADEVIARTGMLRDINDRLADGVARIARIIDRIDV